MPKCHAKAKHTGNQCKNYAVTGYTVCRFHGAGSPKAGRPGGVNKKAIGRYSKYLPQRLAVRYNEAKADTELLDMRDNIALLDVRIGELIESMNDGDTRKHWKHLREAWAEYRLVRYDHKREPILAKNIDDILDRGYEIHSAWAEIYLVNEHKRRTVDSEKKRLSDMQQMISAEQVLMMLGGIVAIIRECVPDFQTQQAIGARLNKLVLQDAGRSVINQE